MIGHKIRTLIGATVLYCYSIDDMQVIDDMTLTLMFTLLSNLMTSYRM